MEMPRQPQRVGDYPPWQVPPVHYLSGRAQGNTSLAPWGRFQSLPLYRADKEHAATYQTLYPRRRIPMPQQLFRRHFLKLGAALLTSGAAIRRSTGCTGHKLLDVAAPVTERVLSDSVRVPLHLPGAGVRRQGAEPHQGKGQLLLDQRGAMCPQGDVHRQALIEPCHPQTHTAQENSNPVGRVTPTLQTVVAWSPGMARSSCNRPPPAVGMTITPVGLP